MRKSGQHLLLSLGHYVVAPFSAHTLAMNSTILAEVIAAGLLLVEVSRQIVRRVLQGETGDPNAHG